MTIFSKFLMSTGIVLAAGAALPLAASASVLPNGFTGGYGGYGCGTPYTAGTYSTPVGYPTSFGGDAGTYSSFGAGALSGYSGCGCGTSGAGFPASYSGFGYGLAGPALVGGGFGYGGYSYGSFGNRFGYGGHRGGGHWGGHRGGHRGGGHGGHRGGR